MPSTTPTNISHLLKLTGRDFVDAVKAERRTYPVVYLAELLVMMNDSVDGSFLQRKIGDWEYFHIDGIRLTAGDDDSPFWPGRPDDVDFGLIPAALTLAHAIKAEHGRYAASAPRAAPPRQPKLAEHTVPLPVITPKDARRPDKVQLAVTWAFDQNIADAEFRLAIALLLGFHNTRTGVCNPSAHTLAKKLGWGIRKTQGVMSSLASDDGTRPFRKFAYFDRRVNRKAVQWAPILHGLTGTKLQDPAVFSATKPQDPAGTILQDGGAVTIEEVSREDNQRTHIGDRAGGGAGGTIPREVSQCRVEPEGPSEAFPAAPSAGMRDAQGVSAGNKRPPSSDTGHPDRRPGAMLGHQGYPRRRYEASPVRGRTTSGVRKPVRRHAA